MRARSGMDAESSRRCVFIPVLKGTLERDTVNIGNLIRLISIRPQGHSSRSEVIDEMQVVGLNSCVYSKKDVVFHSSICS